MVITKMPVILIIIRKFIS